MSHKAFCDAADRLLKDWACDCGFQLNAIKPRDLQDLKDAIAEKFEFYVRDGIAFARMPQEKVDAAMANLKKFIGMN